WPWLEQRFVTRDRRRHELLDRPRDNPLRTAIGAGFFTWVTVVFVAGAADRILVTIGFPYEGQIWFFRIADFVAPPVVALLTYAACRELQRSQLHPLRAFAGRRVRRTAAGGCRDRPDRGPGRPRRRARAGHPAVRRPASALRRRRPGHPVRPPPPAAPPHRRRAQGRRRARAGHPAGLPRQAAAAARPD